MSRNLFRTRRAQGDHGAVLVVVAITMTALVSMAAFAVNLGSISLKRRDLQADADAIALDLGRSLDGSLTTAYAGAADWLAEIDASRVRNNFPASGTESDGIRDLLVEPGCFVQATYTVDTACVVADAVKVTATDDVSEFFRFTNGTTSRSAIGRAGEEELAGFSIGSFAARLATADSPLLNSILTESLGFDPVTAGVLGYEGLATAAVSLPLLAAELGLGALTPDQLLASSVTIEDLLEATATVLQTSGGTAAQVALLNALFANVDNPATTILIGDVIGLDTTGGAGTDAFVNVLDIVTGTASVANGSTALTIPSLGVNLPGVLRSEVSLDLIEGPRRYRGPEGTSGSTAQLRIPLLVYLPLSGVTLDVELEGAGATGTIADITCDATGRHLDIDVVPRLYNVTTGRVEVRLGDIPGVGTLLFTLSLLTGGVVGANTTLFVDLATLPVTGPPFAADFDVPPDVLDEPGVARSLVTVRSTPPGSLSLPTSGLVIKAENAGAPILQATVNLALTLIGGLVTPVLSTALTNTNNLVLNPLMATLGVNVAGADITATDITCGTNGSPLLVG